MNVPHPYHPDSPLYQEMVDAGRIATRRGPYGGSRTCQESVEFAPQMFSRCGEPIVTSVPRGFPSSEPLHLCITHARRLYDEGERRMEWRCSVCGAVQQYPSWLDDSGRCNRCAP